MTSKLTYIDLFAGAGGLSEGFTRAGFEAVAHVEIDKDASDTLLTRQAFHILSGLGGDHIRTYNSYLKGEMTREDLYLKTPRFEENRVINAAISADSIDEIFATIDDLLDKKEVDLIIGGPPCQAYSLAGRSRKGKEAMESDPRASLFLEYAKFLERYQPKVFVFENVAGLLSFKNGGVLELMREEFERVGYKIDFKPWVASDYGVLQERKRLIIIGWKKELPLSYPSQPKELEKTYHISNVFADLPKLKSGQGSIKNATYLKTIDVKSKKYLSDAKIKDSDSVLTWHIARPHNIQDVEIYKWYINEWDKNKRRPPYNELPERLKSHKNQVSFNDRFKVVLAESHASQTVVAHICKDGHYYIHPDIKQARSITVREAARLQSFPDSYFFEGSRTSAFKQIGNAVPPLLATVIADTVKTLFMSLENAGTLINQRKSVSRTKNIPTQKLNLL